MVFLVIKQKIAKILLLSAMLKNTFQVRINDEGRRTPEVIFYELAHTTTSSCICTVSHINCFKDCT